ncbi:MAG: hypothetical protein ABSF28_02515 [Terracidiphilus sp.]|jgi:hypothetical protein
MSRATACLLYWSPRAFSIAFAIFLSLFALDVFNEVHGFRQTVFAFSIHLVPAMVIVAILIVAWRWEWIGTGMFSLAAVYYAVTMLSRNVKNWPAVSGISLPLLLIAAMFLICWIQRSNVRPAH